MPDSGMLLTGPRLPSLGLPASNYDREAEEKKRKEQRVLQAYQQMPVGRVYRDPDGDLRVKTDGSEGWIDDRPAQWGEAVIQARKNQQKALRTLDKVQKTWTSSGKGKVLEDLPRHMWPMVQKAAEEVAIPGPERANIPFLSKMGALALGEASEMAYDTAKAIRRVPGVSEEWDKQEHTLRQIREAEDRTAPIGDPNASWHSLSQAPYRAAQMAPYMYGMMGLAGKGGAAAQAMAKAAQLGKTGTKLAVRGGMSAAITAGSIPIFYEKNLAEMREIGFQDEYAQPAAMASATLEGVIESIIPQPIVKGLGASIRQGAKAAVKKAMLEGARFGVELSEEGFQRLSYEAAKTFASWYDDQVPDMDLSEALPKAVEEVLHAGLPLALLMGGGGAANAALEGPRRRTRLEELRKLMQAKDKFSEFETAAHWALLFPEVAEKFAGIDHVPSRAEWERVRLPKGVGKNYREAFQRHVREFIEGRVATTAGKESIDEFVEAMNEQSEAQEQVPVEEVPQEEAPRYEPRMSEKARKAAEEAAERRKRARKARKEGEAIAVEGGDDADVLDMARMRARGVDVDTPIESEARWRAMVNRIAMEEGYPEVDWGTPEESQVEEAPQAPAPVELIEGKPATTQTGRQTAPVPAQDGMDEWLVSEAAAEANATDGEWSGFMIRELQRKAREGILSDLDRSNLRKYLFGEESAPQAPQVEEVPQQETPVEETPQEQAPEATPEAVPAQQQSILDAYSSVASKPNSRVDIADLREALPDMSREEFDAAILDLERRGIAALYPAENPADRWGDAGKRRLDGGVKNSVGEIRPFVYIDTPVQQGLLDLVRSVNPNADQGAMTDVPELRKRYGEGFDEAVWEAVKSGRLAVHRHGSPATESEELRNQYLRDKVGNYYHTISIRPTGTQKQAGGPKSAMQAPANIPADATVNVRFRDPKVGDEDLLDSYDLGDAEADADSWLASVKEQLKDENYLHYEYWVEVDGQKYPIETLESIVKRRPRGLSSAMRTPQSASASSALSGNVPVENVGNVEKPVSQKDFFRRVLTLFGIVPGKDIGIPGAYGAYDHKKGTVHLIKRFRNGIQALAHEVAHHIERLSFEQRSDRSGNIFQDAQNRYLQATSVDQYDSAIRAAASLDPQLREDLEILSYYAPGQAGPDVDTVGEGFAEFLRAYMTNPVRELTDSFAPNQVNKAQMMGRQIPNNPTLKQLAPAMWDWFHNGFAKEHADLYDKVQQMRRIGQDFFSQGAWNRGAASMTENEPLAQQEPKTRGEKLRVWWHNLLYNWADQNVSADELKQRNLRKNPYLYEHQGVLPSYDWLSSAARDSTLQASQAAEYGVHILSNQPFWVQWGTRLGLIPMQDDSYWAARLGMTRLNEVKDLLRQDMERGMTWISTKGRYERVKRAWRSRGSNGTLREFAEGVARQQADGTVEYGMSVGMSYDDMMHILNDINQDEQMRYQRAFEVIAKVNNDILKYMLLVGAISHKDYNRILAKHGETYIPMIGPWIYDSVSVRPTGALRSGSFLKSRGEAKPGGHKYMGNEMERLNPFDATMIRLQRMYELAFNKSLQLGLLLESSPEMWKMLERLGLETNGLTAPDQEGGLIEIIQRKEAERTGFTLSKVLDQLEDLGVVTREAAAQIRAKKRFDDATGGDWDQASTRRIAIILKTYGLPYSEEMMNATYNGGKSEVEIDRWYRDHSAEDAQRVQDFADMFGHGNAREYFANGLPQEVWDSIHDTLDDKMAQTPSADEAMEVFHKVRREDIPERVFPVTFFNQEFYIRLSDEVYKLMTDRGPQMNKATATYLRLAQKILRWGTVAYSPQFAVQNPSRDIQVGMFQSKGELDAKSIIKYPGRAIATWFAYAKYRIHQDLFDMKPDLMIQMRLGRPKYNEIFDMYDAMTGNVGSRLGYLSGMLGNDQFKSSMKRWTPVGNFMYYLQRGGGMLGHVVAGSDSGPRIIEAIEWMKRKGWEMHKAPDGKVYWTEVATGQSKRPPEVLLWQAMRAASEVTTDFGRQGYKARQFDRWFLFFGATLGSQYATLHTVQRALGMRDSPADQKIARQRLAVGTAMMVAFQLLYELMRGGDDDYEEEPDWLWTRYWTIPLGGNLRQAIPKGLDEFLPKDLRLAKSYDYAFISNIVQAHIRQFTIPERNAIRAALIKELQLRDPTGISGGAPTVAGVTPFVEVFFNYKLFYGTEIDKPGEMDLYPHLRGLKDDEVSSFAKMMSGVMPTWMNMSPRKIDHLTRGIGGTMAHAITHGDFRKVSGWSSLFPTKQYHDSVNAFYDTAGARRMKMRSLKFDEDPAYAKLYGDYLADKRYATLLNELREYRDKNSDKAGLERQVDEWIVNLARERMGMERREAYGNFWTDDKPAELKQLAYKHRKYFYNMATANPPSSGKEDEVEKWRSRLTAGAKWLKDH